MKNGRVSFVAATILFACSIAAALLFLIIQGNRHDRVLVEYHASRALNEMIDRFAQSDSTSEPSLAPVAGVRGFGLFDSERRMLFGTGSVGENALETGEFEVLPGGALSGAGSEIATHSGNHVRIVRKTGPGFAGSGGNPDPAGTSSRGRAGRYGGGSRYWIIDYVSESVITDRRLRLLFVFLLCLAIAGLAGIVLRLGRSLRRIEERAQRNEALAQLGAAARTITHEIKNPLAAIRLQTSLLKRLTDVSDATRAPLDAVDEEVERIANLVEAVRHFLNNPRGTPTRIDATTEIRALTPRQTYPIDVRDDGASTPIYMDRLRFHSVITNLCLNAHQAMTEKNIADPVSVTIEAVPARGRDSAGVRVSVSDSGPGIPIEIRSSVFDPFFTTRTEGTGIGLATVQTFVTAADGSVTISDRPGGGTIVSVLLPLRREEDT